MLLFMSKAMLIFRGHSPGVIQKLKAWIQSKTQHLLKAVNSNDTDYSVYTGKTGLAMLFLRLADTIYKGTSFEEELVKAARSVCDSAQKFLRGKRITFLCGDAGPLALSAVLAHREGNEGNYNCCISELQSMVDRCCNDSGLPDEMLYGRAGFLFSLLFVRKHCGNHAIADSALSQVCQSIIKSGSTNAGVSHAGIPLKYEWHEKEYIGAAHGYLGILFQLLHPDLLKLDVVQSSLNLIKETLDIVIDMRFQSGNFPSSVGNNNDKLVQWCHGAPGAVNTLIRAYQVFSDAKYLDAAAKCCDVIWDRGLLLKGYGICHGTAGNAYAFLEMFKATKNEKYLYHALKFGEWCLEYGKHGCRVPDRPLSLYEGLAGTVYFLVDLTNPENAGFPGYEI
ncbi:lanC-like protein 2 isoform X2 [Rhopilema esculentum]|uniref:lanC-like protein 2 isoform X2 n=1 Tax=Rhopilema esculentum TaxID=499914 RepID=UPI0031E1FE93